MPAASKSRIGSTQQEDEVDGIYRDCRLQVARFPRVLSVVSMLIAAVKVFSRSEYMSTCHVHRSSIANVQFLYLPNNISDQ